MLLNAPHFMMLHHDLSKWPGRFRPGDIHIDEAHTGRRVYTGPDADDIPSLISELIDWLAGGEPKSPLLVRASMAHLNLVKAHPWRDGNGRLSTCSDGSGQRPAGDRHRRRAPRRGHPRRRRRRRRPRREHPRRAHPRRRRHRLPAGLHLPLRPRARAARDHHQLFKTATLLGGLLIRKTCGWAASAHWGSTIVGSSCGYREFGWGCRHRGRAYPVCGWQECSLRSSAVPVSVLIATSVLRCRTRGTRQSRPGRTRARDPRSHPWRCCGPLWNAVPPAPARRGRSRLRPAPSGRRARRAAAMPR
ncbi:hypothetical protein MED15_01076 [Micromonospora noduli]|uniref:Fido domain-containing protein n=1 Tax=Micromonospora noduli TaxID=709876 RepID=A0ABX9D9R4_9ACTN|nr:hypothetical protein MED15_01076 [Micromonospora noduli]